MRSILGKVVMSVFDACWRWLGGVRRHDSYTYSGKKFHLSADKCDNLRQTHVLAASLRHLYLAQCGRSRCSAGGALRDVQNANLMVLREFSRICEKWGFTYIVHGGSLLGAWRHGGFIPWDDDVDVVMPRGEYEKIIDAFNADCAIPSLRARFVSPSRGVVFIKIEAVGEPMIFLDIFPYDTYADEPDQALRWRLEECLEKAAAGVLPDKNPLATYKYYAAVRAGLGLTPVPPDAPGCRSVLCLFECRYGRIFDSMNMFPIARMDFEGLSVPVPADSGAVLRALYRHYERLPLSSGSHFKSSKPTIARMLNVKRFLRSDSLHFTVPIPGRARSRERWQDRLVTVVRNALAPVFTIITHDTMKEYRFFSWKTIFRLRADRLIRGRLEMIESYSRLLRDGRKFPLAEGWIRQQQLASAGALARDFQVCNSNGLVCWLWRDSLLGAVRSETFADWDKTAVLLMLRADYERFSPLFNASPDMGGLRAELVWLHGGLATVVVNDGKKLVTIVPCDFCPDDWDRNNYTVYMKDSATRTAITKLKAENDVEGLYGLFAAARKRMGIGVESAAAHSLFPGWDCPGLFEQCHVLSVKYYMPAVKWNFEGIESRIPADHDMVLASLYEDYFYHVQG